MNNSVRQLIGKSNPSCKVYDAGFVQRREWMLHKVRADQYPFNISTCFEMDSFEPLLIQRIIDLVVERHEILRTTLKVVDGILKQLIHAPGNFPVAYTWFDLTKSTKADKPARYQEILGRSMRTSFDFETGPLFRVLVFGLEPDHYSIHFIFHHVISDHHSLGLFDREVMEMYKQFTKGGTGRSRENAIQYRDYTRFENELLDTAKGDKYRTYWEGEITNGFPVFNICGSKRIEDYGITYRNKVTELKERISRLPGVDARFMASVIRRYQEDDGGKLVFGYNNALFEKCIAFCEAGPHGWLCLLLATLMVALYKLSGQVKFVFDIPGSGRASRQYDQTMGWLTSGGPCFFDIGGYSSTDQLLSYINRQLFALSRHCLYPFEAINAGDPYSPEYRIPAFCTLMYNKHEKIAPSAGILVHEPEGHTTYQDISFFFTVHGNGLIAEIIYNNALFDATMAEGIISRQAAILEDVLTGKHIMQDNLPGEK